MHVFSRWLLAAACLGACAPQAAYAQADVADPTPVRALRAFTRDSGSRELPQSTVTAVHEDREGVIWVLTLDGVAQIEHAAVTRLASSPDAPLSGPYYDVIDRRAGGVHMTGDDSVVTWTGSAWSRTPTPVTFASIAEEASGRLVAVDRLGSVWEYASDRRWIKLNRQSDAASLVVAASPQGVVYAGGAGGVREVRDQLQPPIGRLSSPVIALHVSRAGDIWSATEDGRLQVVPSGSTQWLARPVDGWDGGAINAIAEDVLGRIWIGGERGRAAFGGVRAPFRIWTPANGLTPATINSIAGDRTGGVWFGFTGYGLQQWLGDAWSHRPYWIESRAGEAVVARSVTPTRDGYLVAVGDRGVWRWNGRTLETLGAEHGLNEDVRFAVEPEPGVIWAGTRRGLFESRSGGLFRRVFSLSVSAGYINGIFRSPDGNWWAATEEAGIFVLDAGGWRAHLRLNSVLPDVNVRHIVWRDDELWVATARGLAAYNTTTLVRLDVPVAPAAVASPNVLLPRPGALWAGGTAGLAVLVDGAWQSPDVAGVSSSRILALAEGPDGSLWVGGSEGIARFKDDRWTIYDTTSGLLSEETNAHGLMVLPNGDVFAGMMGGLAHFSAAAPVAALPPLRVFWRRDATRFAVDAVTLPADERGVALQWSAPWPRPVGIEYRTRIPGLRDRWSPPQTASELRVENLAPGDWEIEVAARLPGSGEDAWSEPLQARVTVAPYWYETMAVRLGGVLLLAVAVAGVIRWRTGRLTRRARQLERLVERELARTKILRGLLPICSFCKKIRDDGGYWNQLEQYIASNSQADFSHGLCPDCLTSEYPELAGVPSKEEADDRPR